MAIAFDTAVDGGFGNLTWSHTFNGSNRLAVIGIMTDTGSDTSTAVDVGGTACSKIDSVQGGNSRYIALWHCVNPPSGTQTITVTATGGIYLGLSMSYSGMNQTGQPDASNTGTASGVSSIMTSATTVADNSWMVMLAGSSGNVIIAGSATTFRTKGGARDYFAGLDSNGVLTPAGSHSLAATDNPTDVSSWGAVVASFSPAAGGGGSLSTRKSLLGVGI